jgi:uncharacterized membrane protein
MSHHHSATRNSLPLYVTSSYLHICHIIIVLLAIVFLFLFIGFLIYVTSSYLHVLSHHHTYIHFHPHCSLFQGVLLAIVFLFFFIVYVTSSYLHFLSHHHTYLHLHPHCSLFQGVLLAVVFLFLFIGFSAFSSPKDPAAGMLNAVISLLLDLVALQVCYC